MFNKVILVGNLTRDPEIRYTPNGTAVASVGIATNRKYGDKEETFFGEVTVWGKQAETVCQYLKKGSKTLICGRLNTRKWEDSGGKTQSKTEIIAEDVKFMDSKPKQQEHQNKSPEPQVDDQDIPF